MVDDVATRLVQTLVDIRQSRNGAFPSGLFQGELGWDLLLGLFLADARSETVTGRMITDRFGDKTHVASRWLKYLTAEQLIAGDGAGNLDEVVTLTPTALHLIEEWAHLTGEKAQSALCTEIVRKPI